MIPSFLSVIDLLEAEICTKMLKKLSEKLRAKFPATTPSCSMVKIGHLEESSWNLNLKQAREKANHTNKKKPREKGKGKKKISKVEKPKAVGHFLKIMISAHAWAKMSWTRF